MKPNPESELCCKDCSWFQAGLKVKTQTGEGTCHRYPPQPKRDHIAQFPLVEPTDWCGEFEPISNTDELRYLDASIPPQKQKT